MVDQAWFVVELCESVKAVKLQIANFELYSSSPHQFRVWIGNMFPARDKDWTGKYSPLIGSHKTFLISDWLIEFGTFHYEDVRSIQTFTNEVGVVGKYAKVE